MSTASPSPDPVRSRYPSSTLQNLTDELLRDQSASIRDLPQHGSSFGRADALHDPKSRSASDNHDDNPLRPLPLAFSPKPPSHSTSNSPTQQEPPAQSTEYHGGAFVKSPTGSVASHFSKGTMKSRNSVKAPRSMSRSSRPEPYREGRPLDSPMVKTMPTSPDRTQSMFSFDEGQQAEREFFTARRASDRTSVSDRQLSQHSYHDEPIPPIPADYLMPGSPERGPSNASTIPGSMFRDFDGVHLDEVEEEPEHAELEQREAAERLVDRDNPKGLVHEAQTEVAIGDALSEHAEHAPEPPKHAAQPSEAEAWFNQARQEAADALEGDTERKTSPEPAPDQDDTLSELRSDLSPLRAAPKEDARSRQQRRWKEPPPNEGMVYYPAPVPRNLNLPKRLSQMPDRDIQAQRRSQMISTMTEENRRSVPWLSSRKSADNLKNMRSPSPDEDRGRSRRKQPSNMKNLPPQLRASLFFDQPAIEHKVQLKRGSAMLTFEEMLDASTSAPVTAFTGITDAYVPQGHGRTTSMMMTDGRPESRQSRGSRLSMIMVEGKSDGRASRASMLSGKRSKSVDRLNQAGNRSSSVLSVNRGIRVVRSEDGLSRLDFEPDEEELVDEQSNMLDQPSDDDEVIRIPGQAAHEEQLAQEEEAEQLINEEDDEIEGPPTTLLAELQMRKAKLRQRTRTAANAFPKGMHSTLLELEAVAQVEKRKRQNKRTALAWEDPHGGVGQSTAEEVDDDDVPLGMLFPERQGLAAKAGQRDVNRAMGLMEQREMEQNEPLSARRNRLLGIKPAPPPPPPPSQPPPEEDKSEHGDETLAQRTRRLQTSRALDEAIGVGSANAHNRAVSDDFASEMMSQFGGLDKPAETAKAAAAKQQSPEPEEETLGQRRKRLQAEALSRGKQQPRQSSSMANLLAAAPIGHRDTSGSTGPSIATSGLLGDAQARREREKAHILEQNTRSGLGIGLGSHLVDLPASRSSMNNMPQIYQPTAGAAMAARGWGIPAGNFAHGFGALPANPRHHPRGSMLWAAQEEQRDREARNAYPRQISGQLAMGPTYAAGAQAVPLPPSSRDPETMSPVQRENIDRWRQSVMM